MIHFVGAGSGAADLITVRGSRLVNQADVIIYAGSLVNPELLEGRKPECRVYNSAKMTLEEVFQVMKSSIWRRCGFTQGIRVSTGPSGSRWIFWIRRGSLMITVRGSALSAARLQP